MDRGPFPGGDIRSSKVKRGSEEWLEQGEGGKEWVKGGKEWGKGGKA